MKLLSCSAVAAIVLAFASAAPAQDKPVQLKFSHWVPPTHPMHAAAVAWAESIDKASNGTIKITIFPAQQLGKAFDHYNMARDGIADISHVNPGYEPGRFPIIGAVGAPVHLFQRQGRKRGARCVVSPIRRAGNEGRPLLPGVRARSGHVALHPEEGGGAGRHVRAQGASAECGDRQLDDAARRHQRAGRGARDPRRAGKGRGRCRGLAVGIDAAVRHRQGHQVSHRLAALCLGAGLGPEQEQV